MSRAAEFTIARMARLTSTPTPSHGRGVMRTREPSTRPHPGDYLMKPRIAFFGSSLVSAYWNGAATYYRGIIRALHARGYDVTFYEPDAYERQAHRDIDDPRVGERRGVSRRRAKTASRGRSRVPATPTSSSRRAASACSMRGSKPPFRRRRLRTRSAIFWDVDAPATLERLEHDPSDPFHTLVPQYDLVLTYGGGEPVVDAYTAVGARRCVPIYNALDPATHFPVPPDPRFDADLGFLGNRLPDRERRVEDFFWLQRRPGRTSSFCSAATAGTTNR